MIDFTTPEHKTNILPLRWFANGCERIAHYYLNLYLRYEDPEVEESLTPTRAKIYGRISSIFYKPYFKWGTVYRLDMDAFRKSAWGEGIDPDAIDKLKSDEVLGRLGSDYDENGIPYWEKDDN